LDEIAVMFVTGAAAYGLEGSTGRLHASVSLNPEP
jgi:hypothetical protein